MARLDPYTRVVPRESDYDSDLLQIRDIGNVWKGGFVVIVIKGHVFKFFGVELSSRSTYSLSSLSLVRFGGSGYRSRDFMVWVWMGGEGEFLRAAASYISLGLVALDSLSDIKGGLLHACACMHG